MQIDEVDYTPDEDVHSTKMQEEMEAEGGCYPSTHVKEMSRKAQEGLRSTQTHAKTTNKSKACNNIIPINETSSYSNCVNVSRKQPRKSKEGQGRFLWN